MELRPFFSYYGSKWRLAGKYPRPRYGTVIEPFAGSAGYSLRYSELDIILVDKSPYVCGVWDYIINASTRDFSSLPELKPGERVSDYALCQEAAWLVGFWIARAGQIPANIMTSWYSHPNYKGERNPCSLYKKRLIKQVDSIRHWRVWNGDYHGARGNPVATWFIDPPYLNGGNKYIHNNGLIDYGVLGKWCKSRRGQVIVTAGTGEFWLPFIYLTQQKGAYDSNGNIKMTKEKIWSR